MKRTQWTALFADIRKTIVSFISIALFVALGIGVFLGIKWNEPAIAETSKQYYNDHSYHDLYITFPYGVTEDDLAAVKAIDGVADAEGSYSAHGQAYVGEERYVLIVQSLTDRLDIADILEGTRPSAKNEIGIEKMFADATGLKVGDKLTIDTGKDGKSYLYESEFTITAIVEHPSYIRNDNTYTRGICDIGDGTVDFYVLTSKEAFHSDTYDNCFSGLLVSGEGFDELTPFSSEYDARVADLAKKVEDLGLDCAQNRANSVYNDAMDQISDAEKQISDAENELASGKAEIEDAASEIAKNENLIAEAQDKYENGLAEYEGKNAELKDAHLTLQNSLSEAGFSTDLYAAVVEINEKLSEIESLKAQATDALKMLDNASDYLEQYKEDPGSVDIDSLSALLASLAEFFLNDPDSLSQIETTINGSKDLIEKYIDDSASLTQEERKKVEDLLLKVENEVSTDSAKRLWEKINTVQYILEMCKQNPEAVTQENIAMMIELCLQMGYIPDLDEADALLSDKKAELNGQISKIEEGQAALREALDGIECASRSK